jgi:hypothetical protein
MSVNNFVYIMLIYLFITWTTPLHHPSYQALNSISVASSLVQVVQAGYYYFAASGGAYLHNSSSPVSTEKSSAVVAIPATHGALIPLHRGFQLYY